jgi:hypothetical protein
MSYEGRLRGRLDWPAIQELPAVDVRADPVVAESPG